MSKDPKQILEDFGFYSDELKGDPSDLYKSLLAKLKLEKENKLEESKLNNAKISKSDLIMIILHLFFIAKNFKIYDTTKNDFIEDQLLPNWEKYEYIYKNQGQTNTVKITGDVDKDKLTVTFENSVKQQEKIVIVLKYFPSEIQLQKNDTIELIAEIIMEFTSKLELIYKEDDLLQVGMKKTPINYSSLDDHKIEKKVLTKKF